MLLIYYISKGNCVCLYKHPGGKLGIISFLRAVLLVPTNLAENHFQAEKDIDENYVAQQAQASIIVSP